MIWFIVSSSTITIITVILLGPSIWTIRQPRHVLFGIEQVSTKNILRLDLQNYPQPLDIYFTFRLLHHLSVSFRLLTAAVIGLLVFYWIFFSPSSVQLFGSILFRYQVQDDIPAVVLTSTLRQKGEMWNINPAGNDFIFPQSFLGRRDGFVLQRVVRTLICKVFAILSVVSEITRTVLA